MSKKVSFLRSLFVALLLVCNLFVSLVAPAASGIEQRGYGSSYVKLLSPALSGYSLKCKISSGDNTRIKVRFMGGDCGYHPGLPFCEGRVEVYGDQVRSGDAFSFILPPSQYSFGLRGPPGAPRHNINAA